MASPVRTLTVNFTGRTENLDKAYKRVAKGSSLMSDKIGRATRRAGMAFGLIGGAAFGAAAALKPMIDRAADVQESLSKNTVVFGENAAAVEAFAEKSLQAFGVTRRAALEATGVIGTLGKAMGMTEADSASMATTLTGLAGDMASFNNASVEETLTAIQAGLRGEAEPLRRFGVLLDAATLKAKALEQGIIKNTKDALTPQQKALAAYAVILEQTNVQMGDFERTSDSATNQQKLLAGTWDDLQTQIGEALLPAFTSLVAYVNENVMPAFQGLISYDWSQFTFDDLQKAIGDAEADITQFLLETGHSMGLTIFEGMVDSFASRRAKEGVVKATKGTIEDALGDAGGINIAEGFVLTLWSAIFGDGTEAEQAFRARFQDLLDRFDPGLFTGGADNPDFDRGPEHSGAPPGAGHPASPAGPLPDNRLPGGGRIPGGFQIPSPPPAPAAAAGPPNTPIQQEIAAVVAATVPAAVVEAAAEVAKAVAAPAPPPAPEPVDPALEEFLRVVGTPDWNNFIKAQAQGGPPNTQIVINAPAVSGQEVVDAIGQYTNMNGALPDWWTQ